VAGAVFGTSKTRAVAAYISAMTEVQASAGVLEHAMIGPVQHRLKLAARQQVRQRT